MSRTAIVIGGGWAGCSAAHEMTKRGWQVTLIERAKYLGGRAGSSMHPKLGIELDTGQHLFLGAYEQSLRLLKELGTAEGIQLPGRLEVDYYTSRGLVPFRAWPVPGPLSLAGALLGFPLLSAQEKREALLFGMKAFKGLLRPESLRRTSVAAWLKRGGQSEGLIRKFWEPLCLAVINLPSEKAQAELLAVALKRGFLKGGRAAALGVPLKPLSRLLEPLKIHQIRFGAGSKSVQASKDGVSVTLDNGEALHADAAVIALPASLAAKQAELDIEAAALIEGSPIITAHLLSDGPILPSPFGVFAPEAGDGGFDFQWAFDRTALCGERGPGGETLSCFLASAAKRMAGMSQDAILLELKRQLSRRFSFDPSRISAAAVLKEAKATPAFGPGASRPSQKTKFRNLALAGDWTDTGLPSTIEGAVVSGLLAADVLDRMLIP